MMKNLRELAKEYAQNVIDRDSYRKSRSELIQGICAGEIEVETREYLAPLENSPEELDDTRENIITQFSDPAKNPAASEKPKSPPAAKPESIPSPSQKPPGIFKQKNILIGMTAIVLLAIVTLTILLFLTTDDSSIQKTEVQVVKNNSGQDLITAFIQRNNWSQDSTRSFVISWQSLTEDEHSAAEESPEMKRLMNSIYQQLLNERALLSLGDIENAVANQRLLVNFADHLGINDERLTVLEPEPEPEIELQPTSVDIEIEEIAIITITDLDLDSDVETMTEEVSESGNDLLANDEESLNSLTEEPPVAIAAVSNQIESSPAAITESVDPVEETIVQEEVTKTEIRIESEETKIVTQKTTNKASCKTSLVKSRKPFCRDKIEGIGNGPTMVVIRSGKFTMGGKEATEQPAHTVTINSPFAMSVHEISFGDYEIFCQSTKSPCPKQPWSGKDYPVVSVTHSEATAYADWLSQKTGQTYRLPSEAEWEYAARAGTRTVYPFGDEILISNAVFSDKKKLSAPLPKSDRSINKNKFRLYHMVGNVREWVADTWSEGYSSAPDDGSAHISTTNEFIVRGGSYADSSEALRSGARDKQSSADNYTGFRVFQELSE